jgi:hypothetical protein
MAKRWIARILVAAMIGVVPVSLSSIPAAADPSPTPNGNIGACNMLIAFDSGSGGASNMGHAADQGLAGMGKAAINSGDPECK